MTSKHDRITNSLEKIVRTDVAISGKNQEYGNNTRVYGEIDYFMYREGHLWIVETKSNPSNEHLYRKAMRQIDRAMKPDMFIAAFEDAYNLPVLVAHGYYLTNIFITKSMSKDIISPVLRHLQTRHYNE